MSKVKVIQLINLDDDRYAMLDDRGRVWHRWEHEWQQIELPDEPGGTSQEDLLDFVDDKKNIEKAVNGSMNKRLVVAPISAGRKADYYTDGVDDQVQINAAIAAAKSLGDVDKPIRWRSEKEFLYWYVNDYGCIDWTTEMGIISDIWRYKIGNYFQSCEQAEQYKKLMEEKLPEALYERN